MENTAPSFATVLREAPLFLPDATYGVVRATDAADLEDAGVRMVMVSAFHLMRRPGTSTIKALGVKAAQGFDNPHEPESWDAGLELMPELTISEFGDPG